MAIKDFCKNQIGKYLFDVEMDFETILNGFDCFFKECTDEKDLCFLAGLKSSLESLYSGVRSLDCTDYSYHFTCTACSVS